MEVFIKRITAISIILLLTIPLPILSANATSSNFKSKPQNNENYKPGEIIVKFKQNISSFKKAKIKKIAGVKETIDHIGPERKNVQLLKLKPGISVKESVSILEKQSAVEYAEPNYGGRGAYSPNDTYFSNQWGLNNTGQVINGKAGTSDADMDLPEAWDYIGSISNTVVVAVVDSGIDLTHPDLVSKIWQNSDEIPNDGIDNDSPPNGYIDDVNGYDWVRDDSIPDDEHGHGTIVSGIIGAAAGNGTGVAGIAGYPSNAVKIMPLKVLDNNNRGVLSDWAEAINYAADNGADVINLSLIADIGSDTQALQDAINDASSKGIIITACAGNDGNSDIRYPAGLDNVVGVGSTIGTDERWAFSNYNSSVDLSAPGWYIYSTATTYPAGGGGSLDYAYYSGTSMANAAVSGLAALIKAKWPAYNATDIQQILQNNAKDLGAVGRDDYFGYGRVSAVRIFDTSPPSNLNVSSPTHPYQTSYYRSNDPRFSFSADDPSDVGGYSYTLNQSSTFDVDLISDGIGTSETFSDRANGAWYFHVRAADVKGNWSGVKTRRINIDNYKPRTRAPRKASIRKGSYGRLYWYVSDPYAGGKAYVWIKIKQGSVTKKVLSLGLKNINSLRYQRYKALLSRGKYKMYVLAKDRAGNRQYSIAGNYLTIN